jgi:uncharacterized protein YaeQ
VAKGATIHKCELAVCDLDRGRYATHSLTLARHPSETEERLMVRLLAFALFAGEALEFGRGLSTEDEPDLWRRDPTGAIDLWIDVGLPDERNLRKACGRARQVVVLAYGGRKAEQWWAQNGAALGRQHNLRVLALPAEAGAQLQSLASRSMKLNCTIQDGHVWLADEAAAIELVPQCWSAGETA